MLEILVSKTPHSSKSSKTEKIAMDSPSKSLDIVESDLFRSLDTEGSGFISSKTLIDKFQEAGIEWKDPRLSASLSKLDNKNTDAIDYDLFKDFYSKSPTLIKKVLQGGLAIPDFKSFCEKLTNIYDKVKKEKGGKVADYIPQLERVNPELFGVSICTVDGQRFNLGDSEAYFCAQSSCKPINYCLSLENLGEEKVHSHVGREPSGKGFNELSLNTLGLPHNPMINSGAIMCCSLLKPDLRVADRFEYVMNMWARLCGNRKPRFNNSVYLSERETGDRNYALGYFMKEKKAFPAKTNLTEVLEFYFQCCSIEVNTEMMSTVAATLATAGICPLTDERIFSPDVVKNCLSLMSTCGMYDFSGEFAFKIGLPAKSGVSGVIMLVVPNLMGICIWSPSLDVIGNSVRGTKFCDELIEQFNFHAFDSLIRGHCEKNDPRLKKNIEENGLVNDLLWASSQGDLCQIQQLIAEGVSINATDYDGRSAIHLAASEGHLSILNYIVNLSVDLNARDRWNNTALDDAIRQNHKDIVKFLVDNGAVSGEDIKLSESLDSTDKTNIKEDVRVIESKITNKYSN